MGFVALAPQVLAPTTVAVAATSTVVATFDTKTSAVLSVQITNLDGSQVFTGLVTRRLDPTAPYAPTTLPDFSGIGPGGTVVADLDVRGTSQVQITGAMSGAGGNISITARRRASS